MALVKEFYLIKRYFNICIQSTYSCYTSIDNFNKKVYYTTLLITYKTKIIISLMTLSQPSYITYAFDTQLH